MFPFRVSTHTHASICSFRACTKQQVVVLRVGIQETTSFVVSRVVPRVQLVPVPQQAFFLPCRYRDYNPFSPSVRTGVAGAGPEDKACFFFLPCVRRPGAGANRLFLPCVRTSTHVVVDKTKQRLLFLCVRAGTEYQAPGIKHLWWVAPSTTSWRFRVVPETPKMFSFRVGPKHSVPCRCRRKKGFFFFSSVRAGTGRLHEALASFFLPCGCRPKQLFFFRGGYRHKQGFVIV